MQSEASKNAYKWKNVFLFAPNNRNVFIASVRTTLITREVNDTDTVRERRKCEPSTVNHCYRAGATGEWSNCWGSVDVRQTLNGWGGGGRPLLGVLRSSLEPTHPLWLGGVELHSRSTRAAFLTSIHQPVVSIYCVCLCFMIWIIHQCNVFWGGGGGRPSW